MRYSKLILLPAILLVLLTGLFLRVGRPNIAHAAPTVSCGQWSVISSPNSSTNSNVLSGVAAISSNDVWAVGNAYNSQRSLQQTLTEHWNGTRWSVVPSATNSSGNSYLAAVTALSSNNVWAVGSYINNNFPASETLIEHWNGTKWSYVPSPNPGFNTSVLNGIAAISATNIWAVGYYNSPTYANLTLVEHWDGTKWKVVPSPNPNSINIALYGVTATSDGTVWAVGNFETKGGYTFTLIEKWNGTQWSIVPSPNASQSSNGLFSVTAIADTDVWAVGGSSYPGTALIEHWNGTQWSIVSSANSSSATGLLGVAAISANNVWAVGDSANNSNFSTLAEQWNGTQWSIIPSPSPTNDSYLNAIASTPGASDLWAVGVSSNHTLIEFYC